MASVTRRPQRTRAPPRRIGVPRALAAHPNLAAAGLFALFVLAYLWPVLLGGKVFTTQAVLYKLAPWQPYAPDDVASFENYLLADVPLVYYPWHEYARQLLHAGVLPAWNPHALAGVPFFSNPQTGLFSIFSLPMWVLSLGYGTSVGIALKLWVAAFGAYLLVRELRLGFLPGLVAGVSWALCSWHVVWLTPEVQGGVTALLPWMLWLIERTFARRRAGSALWLGVVTALALGGGHPGTQVHAMAAAGGYAVLRAALARERGGWGRPLALALGGLGLGALLMGAMLVPEALSSHGTVGTGARKGAQTTLPGAAHMPFTTIRTVLFPDWWGRPSAFETPDSPTRTMFLNYQERTFFPGVVVLLLACVGLGWRAAWRRMAPFAVLGALALAIALHAPGLFQLVEHVPVLDVVENQRLHFVFELAVAVLAAFGLEALLERPRGERRWRVGVVGVALAAGVVAAVGTHATGADAGRTLRHFLTGEDFPRAAVVELTSVGWFLLLALAAGAAVLAARRWPREVVALATVLVAIAALDMLRFAHGYQPIGPGSRGIPPRTPAITYLQRHVRDGRMVGVGLALPADWSMRYGLDDVRGYDPPYPTQRYFALWREANPGQDGWRPMMFDELSARTLRVTGVLGARYMLAPPGTVAARGLGLRPAYAGADATIFANPHAAPRAMVPAVVREVPDEAAARAALLEPAFDPRREVVVEGVRTGGARGRVDVVRERNAEVTLRASLERPGLVVLGDDFTAGWSVRVDGRPARALHVDDVMRGVAVGAGRHTVVWRYAVPGLAAGLGISALAVLGALGGAAWLWARRRRRGRRRSGILRSIGPQAREGGSR